jgi:hypothetical protein
MTRLAHLGLAHDLGANPPREYARDMLKIDRPVRKKKEEGG